MPNQFTVPKKLEDRLAEKVRWNIKTGCLIWTGYVCKDYGHISIRGKQRKVHQVAYELAKGPIPEGLELDHLCRTSLCINPSHLEPVTHQENVLRGQGMAARWSRRTHCLHGHEFTDENTQITRSKGRGPSRRCRTCYLKYQRARYRRASREKVKRRYRTSREGE